MRTSFPKETEYVETAEHTLHKHLTSTLDVDGEKGVSVLIGYNGGNAAHPEFTGPQIMREYKLTASGRKDHGFASFQSMTQTEIRTLAKLLNDYADAIA